MARLDDPRRGALFGAVEDDTVRLLSGCPWLDPETGATGEVVPLDPERLLAPMVPSKVVAAGRNYLDHVRQMGYVRPSEPNVFLKPPSSVIGPGADVVLPPNDLSREVEHEAELAVVIGRLGGDLDRDDALGAVFGYTCADDVSARDLQRRDASLTLAKGFDTFCPLGPWIETDLDLRQGVSVRCSVNGVLRQDGHTSQLLFDIPTLLAHISRVMTLLPGDVVLTGSPGGSGAMQAGDVVDIEIEGIGRLRHGVRAAQN